MHIKNIFLLLGATYVKWSLDLTRRARTSITLKILQKCAPNIVIVTITIVICIMKGIVILTQKCCCIEDFAKISV